MRILAMENRIGMKVNVGTQVKARIVYNYLQNRLFFFQIFYVRIETYIYIYRERER